MTKAATPQPVARPPVVVVMGHIDHGKSTLLDTIRTTRVVESEAGGITQAVSAYEVVHEGKKITFIDTPGHEAFLEMRRHGARIADIAVLVVAADDGPKPQTLEALQAITAQNLPYLVAINKIDVPGANIERTKQQLGEAGIYLEGYGGHVPFVAISAKTGQNISELLELLLLTAEVSELKGDPKANASGYVLEVKLTAQAGILATVIIKDGRLWAGDTLVIGPQIGKARRLQDFTGATQKIMDFSTPATIWGLAELPPAGAPFRAFNTPGEAKEFLESGGFATTKPEAGSAAPATVAASDAAIELPVIIKADVAGALDALRREVLRLQTERVRIRIIAAGVGNITESDIKLGGRQAVVVGFNVKADRSAADVAQTQGVTLQTFDIIYKLAEWLETELARRAPKVTVEEPVGKATVFKLFGSERNRQIIGGAVSQGELRENSQVKILRRGAELGAGRVAELQSQKVKVKAVESGKQFGALIETRVAIAGQDELVAFELVEK